MECKSIVKKSWKRAGICLALVLCLVVSGSGNTYAKAKKMSIIFSRKKQTVFIGKKLKLKAVLRNKKKGAVLIWKSLNPKVAVVTAKGVVTGKKAGKAKIQVKVKRSKVKAVCTVIVKKKNADSPVPTQNPANNTIPEASPIPEETGSPEESPIPGEPGKPEESPTPGATEKPEESPTPGEPGKPEESPAPDATEKPGENISSPVVAVRKSEDGSQTVFLLARDFEGTVHIDFAGNVFTVSGKVKDALALLQSSYVTKTNGAGTVRVSRVYPQESWTLTDLETGTSYTMWVEARTTFDSAYENCGAIYFSGDVSSIISVY